MLIASQGGSVVICFSPFVSVSGRNRLFPFGIPALGIHARVCAGGEQRKQTETEGNRRFLLERITTDSNGEERICSVAATTMVDAECSACGESTTATAP